MHTILLQLFLKHHKDLSDLDGYEIYVYVSDWYQEHLFLLGVTDIENATDDQYYNLLWDALELDFDYIADALIANWLKNNNIEDPECNVFTFIWENYIATPSILNISEILEDINRSL